MDKPNPNQNVGNPGQLPEKLAAKIIELENRIKQLESAIVVAANGDVEIKSGGALRIASGNKMVIDGDMGVTIQDSLGNSIQLGSMGVVTSAASKTSVICGSHEVRASIATFSGVVKTDTLIARSVVGSSYTPGAGNVW